MGEYSQAIDFLQRIVASLEGDLQHECFDMPGLASVLSRAWLVWCLAEQGRFGEGFDLWRRSHRDRRNVSITGIALSWPVSVSAFCNFKKGSLIVPSPCSNAGWL